MVVVWPNSKLFLSILTGFTTASINFSYKSILYVRRGGGLHGGFTATLVDNFTTYALLTKDGSPPGVSVDLHVRYVLE